MVFIWGGRGSRVSNEIGILALFHLHTIHYAACVYEYLFHAVSDWTQQLVKLSLETHDSLARKKRVGPDPNGRFANVEDIRRAIDAARSETVSHLPKTHVKVATKAAGLIPNCAYNFVYIE